MCVSVVELITLLNCLDGGPADTVDLQRQQHMVGGKSRDNMVYDSNCLGAYSFWIMAALMREMYAAST